MRNHRKKLIAASFLILLLTFAARQQHITIYTIGDSTMAPYDTSNNNPQRGWGQVLSQFFTSDVSVVDAARGGRSSKSFYNEGLWQAVVNQVQPGDYVFIQFAHNDEKTDTAYQTDPWTSYQYYLSLYINETRAKGGIPVLFTPIVRRYFGGDGLITATGQHNMGPGDSLGNFPRAMLALGRELNVPCIDLTAKTKSLVESYGPGESALLYITTDQTHPNVLGATLIAQLAAQGIKDQNLPLASYLNLSTNIVASPTSVSFGDVYVNAQSQELNFSLSGFNLSPASGNVTITAPAGFQVTSTSGSGYSASANIPYTNGSLQTTTIYVKFFPTAVQSYSSNITFSTGGATLQTLQVNGAGIPVPTGLVSASGTWTLATNQIASTTGSLLAGNQSAPNWTGIAYGQSYTAFGSGWQRLATSSYLPTTYSASSYVDFTISPQAGSYYIVNSVTFSALGGGSGNGKLAVYYSTDGFATSTNMGTATLGTTPTTTSSSTSASPISLLNSGSATSSGAQNISFSPNITVKGGQTLTVRLYAWCTTASKYLAMKNMVISGNTTTASAPTAPTTLSVTGILSTTATGGGGVITSDGNSLVTAKGVCWNLTGTPTSPTTGDPKTNDGTGTGAFTSNITGLIPGLTYFVRSYATNSAGTSYGNEVSFTTQAGATPPLVSTAAVTAITTSSAASGGNVSTDGGSPLTARGVCWNTSGNPTELDSHTDNGVDTGPFTSSITGLASSTVYHLRAYATNIAGTGYGSEIIFTTKGIFYNKPSSDLSQNSSWGTNTDGTGNAPDFTKDNQLYNIVNANPVLNNNWTISANSGIVVGNGTDSMSFAIPSPVFVNGKIDVSAHALLVIRNSANLIMGTLNSNSTVYYDSSASITILPGKYGNLASTNDNAGTRAFANGTIEVTGSFLKGSAAYTAPVAGTFLFSGTASQLIPGLTYFNLQVNNAAGCTISDSVILASTGNLTITSGTLSVYGSLNNKSSNIPTLTGTLVIKTGGNYIINGGPIPACTYEASSNVIVASGSPSLISSIGGNFIWNSTGSAGFAITPVTINGNFTMTAGTFAHGNGGVARTVIVTGNMTLLGGSYTVANTSPTNPTTQTLTVMGNLTVSGGYLYASNNDNMGSNGTVNVAGNLIHTGGLIGNGANILTNQTGKIVFNGSTLQTIQTIGFTNNLIVVINNSAGARLSSDLQVDASLNLTSGILSLGTHNLILNPSANIIGTPSASAMVIADGTGQFRKMFSGPGSFTFPIGDNTGIPEYAPATLNVSASAYSSAYITINTTRTKHPNNFSASDYLSRYWTASSSGFTNAVYSGSFTYPSADVQGTESNIYGAQYSNGIWKNVGVINTVTHTFATPAFTDLGDFTGADGSVVPPSPVISATVTGLAFGRVNRNTTSAEKSYLILGHNLSPLDGNVTISAPHGYSVSTVSGSGFDSTLSIPYTGGSLASTTIYVRFSPTLVQVYNGILTNSGGSAAPQNISLTGTGIIPNSELGVNSIVAADGSGDYTTLQAAINAVPVSHPGISPYILYLRPGFYHEKVTIPATLSDIKILGESRDSTILDYTDYVGMSGTANVPGTNAVQTLQVNASNITFENMTIQDTVTVERAVAVNVGNSADKVKFINCNIYGHQDTYYLYNCYRVYHKNCKITGSVDFIFGNGTAVFDSCRIVVNRNGGVLTAAGTGSNLLYGLVFRNCILSSDPVGFDGLPVNSFYLGRPWQNSPKTVFLLCYEPSTLLAAGNTLMNTDPAAAVNQSTLYAEYLCYGPGFNPSGRTVLPGNPNYGRQLTQAESEFYTLANIFMANSKTDSPFPNGDWLPSIDDSPLPVELSAFNSTVHDRDILLDWTTQTEKNSEKFIVERKSSGDWEILGSVKASVLSSSPKQYSFIDKNLQTGRYEYRLKLVDNNGSFDYSKIIETQVDMPKNFELSQNYPNPFNPSTKINYTLPDIAKVILEVYNIVGERIALLVNEEQSAGYYSVDFNSSSINKSISSGVYFYKLTASGKSGGNGFSSIKKMILLK
jgi:lysophospholipase L1-like esterase